VTTLPVNIHATAIVIGTRGLLFVGPSGSGKSKLAFACIATSRRRGSFAALIADDRVVITRAGDRLVASCPPSITGLLELRGSGIVQIETVASAVLDLAVTVISLPHSDRLPSDNERFDIAGMGDLPLLRIDRDSSTPLAVLAALMPAFGELSPF
jgi:serine kinase of HPr protein (carbohydrate metabolism regulator)